MHAVTYGVSRDQMMARHKANHIQVVYANSADDADRAMLVKADDGRCAGHQGSHLRDQEERQGMGMIAGKNRMIHHGGHEGHGDIKRAQHLLFATRGCDTRNDSIRKSIARFLLRELRALRGESSAQTQLLVFSTVRSVFSVVNNAGLEGEPMPIERIATLPALPPRPIDGHKGTFGRVLVVAGSEGMIGAPVFAGTGALRMGSGLVHVAAPRDSACRSLGHA